MFCKNCGKNLNDNAKFCDGCGKAVEQSFDIFNESKTQQDKPIIRQNAPENTQPEKSFWKKKYPEMTKTEQNKVKTIFGVIFGVLAVALIIIIIGATALPKNNQGKVGLTYSNFQKIQNGMTYSEVCNILGMQGTLDTESSTDLGDGTQYHIAIYTWQENDFYDIKVITIMFADGKVDTKSQAGLT